MMTRSLALVLFCSTLALSATAQTPSIPAEALDHLAFRSIGPAVMGGRIHDVEALPDDPSTIFLATASGGLWKTTNKGTTWQSLFDDQPVSTFGDLAIAPSDPNILWVGTGEQNNRQSTSWGNGVYRSTDSGNTWVHLGLTDTRHISRVQVHPTNPDVAYVGALGNLWKGSDARGVYRTTDGGDSWDKVLYIDEWTGVIDLIIHPQQPETLYAATYQRLRRTWGFNGGGPGSGIYRSTDGGDSWEELTMGLPAGDKGRIGLTLSPVNPLILYAIIQHTDASGIYKSTDGGDTWEKVNRLNPRPMYYSHIYADPTDAERVYVMAVEFYRSDNGGVTFRQMPTRPTYDVGVHGDFHTMWVNPSNPSHFYLAGDAGLHESWDQGETYNRINNLPIGQFYAIGVDMETPYNIYGGMQDNHSWMGPSATRRWIGIINDDWVQVGFGDGMYQQPDPTSNRYVYLNSQNGGLTRLDAQTGDILGIRPYPPEEGETYRFDWVTPILLSHHDPATVYFGGNRLFISHDRGQSWEHTADLSRQQNRDSLYLMGVQGADISLSKNDGTSSYGEITTIAESPLDAAILWVGTDDGNVQVSRDGGQSWTNVVDAIEGLPDGTYVSRVMASRQGPGVAYATFDAHRDGDFRPYVYQTRDFGQSWVRRIEGLPPMGAANVLIEHPDNPQVLFLGTEHALFVSTTGGTRWVPFKANLPTTLYDDLVIHPREKDLVVGTHGRSIWVMDDIQPLAEWSVAVAEAPAHLFSIRPATLFHYWKTTSYRAQGAYAGENDPFGALLTYHLAQPVDTVRLIITNTAGKQIRLIGGSGQANRLHRVRWDLRHTPPPTQANTTQTEGLIRSTHILPKLPHPLAPQGPLVSPGTYTVTLEAGPTRMTQTVTVQGDPDMPITASQWQERESYLVGLLALQKEVWDVSAQADTLSRRLNRHKEAGTLAEEHLADADSARTYASRLRQLRGQIYSLANELNGSGIRQGSLYPPTATHRMRQAQLEARLRQERLNLEHLTTRH